MHLISTPVFPVFHDTMPIPSTCSREMPGVRPGRPWDSEKNHLPGGRLQRTFHPDWVRSPWRPSLDERCVNKNTSGS